MNMKNNKRISNEVQASKSKYHDLFKRLEDTIDFDVPVILDTPDEMNTNESDVTPLDAIPSRVPVDSSSSDGL